MSTLDTCNIARSVVLPYPGALTVASRAPALEELPRAASAAEIEGDGRVDFSSAAHGLLLVPGDEGARASFDEVLAKAAPADGASIARALGLRFVEAPDEAVAMEGFALLLRSWQLGPTMEAARALGLGLARRGEIDAAIPWLVDALRLRPDAADLKRALIAAAARTGTGHGELPPGVRRPYDAAALKVWLATQK
jgi:hypothetical protein